MRVSDLRVIALSIFLILPIGRMACAESGWNDGKWRIALVKTAACDACDAGVRHEFEIEEMNSHVIRKWRWDHAGEIHDVFVYGKNLVIWGEAPYGGALVAVLALEDELKEIEIWAYNMRVSETKRYLLYTPWYPRMSVAEGVDYVLIYDLSREPAENMMSGHELLNARYGFGLPVYPRYLRRTARLENGKKSYGGIYDVNTVTWADDDSTLMFVSMQLEGANSGLVVIRLKGDLKSAKSCEVPLIPNRVPMGPSAKHIQYRIKSLEIQSEDRVLPSGLILKHGTLHLLYFDSAGIEISLMIRGIEKLCGDRWE